MGKHIVHEGWNNWGNPANEQTTFYGEYKNSGPGAENSSRVQWSHQLSNKDAASYSLATIFSNEGSALPVNAKWHQEQGTRAFQWPMGNRQ
jgi:pectinesterase